MTATRAGAKEKSWIATDWFAASAGSTPTDQAPGEDRERKQPPHGVPYAAPRGKVRG